MIASMQVTDFGEDQGLGRERETAHVGSKLSRTKLIFGVLLGFCFWFAVPYQFPLELDADPVRAAANEATSYQGNLSRQLAMPLILLITCAALYLLPKLGRVARRSKLLTVSLAYVTWAVASAAWSGDRLISTKRLLVFAIDLLFAFALAHVASVVEVAAFGFACTGIVALLALVADALLLHTFAPSDPDYRFMGVMTANYQAMNLFVCLVCGLTLVQRFPRWLAWMAPLLLFFAGLLYLTRARIGTLLFFLACTYALVSVAKQHLQAQTRALVLLAVCTIVLPAVSFVVARSGESAIAGVFMMGRTDTENTANLSNRAPLWAELSQYASEHLVLGYGFESFWSAERVAKVSEDQGWVVPHAHNTYLDQVLSLGLVGASLYAAMLVGSCWLAWQRYRRNRNESTLMPALLLSWLTLLGMTESIPVIPCVPVLIAYSCVARMCMAERHERRLALHVSPEEFSWGAGPAGLKRQEEGVAN